VVVVSAASVQAASTNIKAVNTAKSLIAFMSSSLG
jgi:hypothetical protein